MKKTVVIIMLFVAAFANAQAFSGKGDSKFQVAANFQKNATGINVNYDLGLGENISVGVSGVYALGINDVSANFGDRFDLKARFSANIGNVLNIDEKFDIYPGLHLGLKNFGGHLGMRYFFSEGFGIFSELNAPFAIYKTGVLTPAETIHNQFNVSFGTVFNL